METQVTIFCNLKGGLGNMMFQIAATESLSIDLKLNSSFPNFHNNISYLKNQREYNHSDYCDEYTNVIKDVNTFHPTENYPLHTFPFEFKKLNTDLKNFWIDGYFQSEKYFINNRNQILEKFKACSNLEDIIKTKYKNIINQKLTSVHVRRGDYVKLNQYHTVLPMDYYNECMKRLDNNTELFLIFSDDIDWCKENFKYPKCTFIENEKDYIEMYLMSYCQNNIISNSSFAWWGAWLNEEKERKVLAPSSEMWFGPYYKHYNSSDIIPESWEKV